VTFFDYPTGDVAAPEPDAQYFLPAALERDWADLLQATTTRRLDAGQTLIEPGAGDRSLYLVIEGRLEVLLPVSRRRWRQVASVGAGNVIGELSFFDGDTRSAMVRALSAVAVAELSREDFTALAGTRPDLALAVAMDLGRILAQRLRRTQATPIVAG
jgi:CRP/FNR family cyclic AMP-dependent transcriptional regulator